MKTRLISIPTNKSLTGFAHALAILALLASAATSRGADVVKADNADNLDQGTSWTNGVAPTSADVAVWEATVLAANTVNLGATTNWGGIRIVNPGGAVGITNAATTLVIGDSGVDTSGGSQTLTLACPVALGTNNVNSPWNIVSGVTLSGGLNGTNILQKTGGGTLTLATGTGTATIQVDEGTVSITGFSTTLTNALNGGTVTANASIGNPVSVMAGGGILQNSANNRTWSGVLSGSAPLTVNCQGSGSTIFTWSGNNTNYTGTITKQGAGILRLSSVNSVSAGTAYIFNGGTMNPNATGTFKLGSLSGTSGTLNPSAAGPFAIGELNTDTTFSGVIGGAGMIFKLGTGTLTLDGANTFSGATTISNGVLQIGSGSTAGKFGTGSVTNESRLVFNRADTLITPNVITGSGSVTNVGAGKVALTGANNYTGPTTITAGTLAFGSATLATGNITVGDNATIGAIVTSAGGTVTNGNVSFGSGCSYEFDLGTFGNPPSMAATNTGTVTFTGNNVTVNVLGTNFTAGTSTITLLRYANRAGTGSFVLGSLPPEVTLVSFSDDTANNRVILTISVGVVVDQTLRWVGDAVGIWDIDNLANQIWTVVGTAQTTNYYEGAAVLFNDAATGTTNIDVTTTVNPSSVTVSNTTKIYTLGGIGSVSGSTGLTKKGSGALVVTNANSYAGLTAIEAGSLRIAGETGAIGGGGVTNNGALIVDRTEATNALPNTFIFSGQITGTGGLTILGVGATNSTIQVDVGAANGNPYSGGTTISNAYVNLVANPNTDATRSAAKSTGLGSGQITFLGDAILELEDYGNGNSSAQAGNLAAPLNIPAGQVGTLRTAGRATVSSALTGSGTLNLAVSYIRNVISGDFSAFTGQVNVTPSPNTTGNQYQIANVLGLPSASVHLVPGVTMGAQGNGALNPVFSGDIIPIGELSGDIGSFVAGVGDTSRNVLFRVGGLNTSSSFDGNFASGHGLIKEGSGTFTLTGTNSYTGSTTVSNGVLALVGEGYSTNSFSIGVAAPGILDVSGLAGGTLSAGNVAQSVVGDGTIRGSLVVGSLGTVSPGFSIGTLTVTNTVTLGGSTIMELNTTNSPATNDMISATAITAGGTLTVTNIGPDLVAGDSFKLFSVPVGGSFAAVNLPVSNMLNSVQYVWTNKTAVDGTIQVLNVVTPVVVNPNPTNITFTSGGGNLTLSWPADHTGWTLQVQTNTRAVGLNTNWFNVDGSSATNQVTLPVDIGNGTVFYRLVYP